jgi:hypothetical protein
VEIALSRMGEDQALGPLPSWEETERIVPGLSGAVYEAVKRDNS